MHRLWRLVKKPESVCCKKPVCRLTLSYILTVYAVGNERIVEKCGDVIAFKLLFYKSGKGPEKLFVFVVAARTRGAVPYFSRTGEASFKHQGRQHHFTVFGSA